MAFTINPSGIVGELEAIENVRASDAFQSLQALRRTDVVSQDGLSGAVMSDRRELAAMAMARARGEGSSVAQVATRNAMSDMGPVQGAGSAAASLAAIRQGGMQQQQLAGRGANARAGESMQAMQQGVNMQAVDRAVVQARLNKQQELALAIASIENRNDISEQRRAANERNAKRGIDTRQYIDDANRRDQWIRDGVGAAVTVAGAGINAYANSSPTADTGKDMMTPQAQGTNIAPDSTSGVPFGGSPGSMVG